MKSLILIVFTIFSMTAIAKPLTEPKRTDAQIEGESYLGTVGSKAVIVFGKIKCEIQATAVEGSEGQPPKSFKIELSCDNKKQILWDISKPAPDDFAFDDPQFQILWAGDEDGDSKIDLELELSPKYSCSKKVIFLSSKAGQNQIVGISGTPKTSCGK